MADSKHSSEGDRCNAPSTDSGQATRLLVAGLLLLTAAMLPAMTSGAGLATALAPVKTDTDLCAPSLVSRGSMPSSDAYSATASGSAYTIYLPFVSRPLPSLKSLITEVSLHLPQPLAAATHSWCTWGGCSLSPRLYHEPLADGRTLVGWTDSSGYGHVSIIASNRIERSFHFGARSVRGLVAHGDGSFAVLLWRSEPSTMRLSKRDSSGGQIWTTNLNSNIAVADVWLGGGRLAYGNGRYIAYFTVRGTSGGFTGHYGDQLTYVDSNGHIQPGGWNWGCSHSMAQLVSYHPSLRQFVSVCSSDCFPGKGVFADHTRVYLADGNCGGKVSSQLGQIAVAERSWKLVFSALARPCCEGHGIALATVDRNYRSSFQWLTNTNGAYERDPVIARLGTSGQTERYLVGWTTSNTGVYWLAVIDGDGRFVVQPQEVTSAGVSWGNRDDSFRTRSDGTVSWVQGAANSRTLRLFLCDGSYYVP
jgi:hypothetical protein